MTRRSELSALLLLAALVGCDDGGRVAADGSVADVARVDPDGTLDALTRDATNPDAGPTPDAAPDAAPDARPDALVDAYPMRPAPTPAGELSAPRGWRFVRGLTHMHSVHSHDACDGDPKPDGQINARCLARFRAAMCHNRFDYVLLTDHPGSFDDIEQAEAFLHRDDDEWIEGDEGPIGNWLVCPDGHRVLLTIGSEGDLMPVMFERKPPPGSIRDRSPEGSALLKAHGALVFQAHIERFTAAELAPLNLDGIEVYNLHANLDPTGELRQLPEVIRDLLDWVQLGADSPHPDLLWVPLFRENPLALAAWDGLTPNGRMYGFAGSDIHENLPPIFGSPDGDRVDSYRRLGSWFSNYLLVADHDRAALRDALANGRGFTTFDVLGPPDGFDFHAASGDAIIEMGGETAFVPGVRIRVRAPTAPPGAVVSSRLIQVTADGPQVVHEAAGEFEFEPQVAAPYRLEVRITPNHLRDALGEFGAQFIRPMVWIYANPIYLR